MNDDHEIDPVPELLRRKVLFEIEQELRKEKLLRFGIDLFLLIIFVSVILNCILHAPLEYFATPFKMP